MNRRFVSIARFLSHYPMLGGFCALTLSCAAVAQAPPFRDAVRANGLVFLSGEIGVAPDGSDALTEGMDSAANSAMGKLGKALRSQKLSFDDVVKCTVMLRDIAAWDRFNKTYVRYFKPDKLPARSAFATGGLAYGALVEVECVAAVPKTAETK